MGQRVSFLYLEKQSPATVAARVGQWGGYCVIPVPGESIVGDGGYSCESAGWALRYSHRVTVSGSGAAPFR